MAVPGRTGESRGLLWPQLRADPFQGGSAAPVRMKHRNGRGRCSLLGGRLQPGRWRSWGLCRVGMPACRSQPPRCTRKRGQAGGRRPCLQPLPLPPHPFLRVRSCPPKASSAFRMLCDGNGPGLAPAAGPDAAVQRHAGPAAQTLPAGTVPRAHREPQQRAAHAPRWEQLRGCVCGGGGTGTRRAPCMHAAAAQGFGVEHRACMQQRRRAGSCARPIQQQLLVSGGVGGGAGKGWRAQPGPDKGRREGPFVSGPGGAAPGADKGGYGVGARGWVYVCVGGVIKLALIALVWARFIDQARSGSPRREGGAVHGGCIPTGGGGGVHPRESAHGGGVSVHGGGGWGWCLLSPAPVLTGEKKSLTAAFGFFLFCSFFWFFFSSKKSFPSAPRPPAAEQYAGPNPPGCWHPAHRYPNARICLALPLGVASVRWVNP